MRSVFKQTLILLILASAIGCGTVSRAAGLPDVKDFTVEAADARKRQIPILVLFKDQYCSYCETVLDDFLLPMQRDPEFADKVILRQVESGSADTLIDFDGRATTYSRFSSKHKVYGVPNVMLFDGNGQVLTSIEGLLTVDFYYGFLLEAINESLAKIKSGNH